MSRRALVLLRPLGAVHASSTYDSDRVLCQRPLPSCSEVVARFPSTVTFAQVRAARWRVCPDCERLAKGKPDMPAALRGIGSAGNTRDPALDGEGA